MTTYEPYFHLEKPWPKAPKRRKGDPASCMAALPVIGALVLRHGAKALAKKVRAR